MSKAQTIDRLEYTRKRFVKQLGLEDAKHEEMHRKSQEVEHGLKVCPNCGSKALRHDSGCKSCLSCGWSACTVHKKLK